jgi:hypothetical protein
MLPRHGRIGVEHSVIQREIFAGQERGKYFPGMSPDDVWAYPSPVLAEASAFFHANMFRALEWLDSE